MAHAELPKHLRISLACALPGFVLTTAAIRRVCFSLPGAPQQQSISVDHRLHRRLAASARWAVGPVQGQPRVDTAMGILRTGIGACAALLSGRLVHARARARVGRACRRAAPVDEPAASDEPAAPAAAAPAASLDLTLQPGVLAPYGEPGVAYWDPAGLAKDIDVATWRQYRQAELKHGRLSMMALFGLLTQHSNRVPGLEDVVPSGLGAAGPGTLSSACLGLVVITIGLIELNLSDDDREPGDFGDPVGFASSSGFYVGPHNMDDWKNFEISHGRLAMIGVIGTLVAEYATGLDGVQQWGRLGAARERSLALLFPEGPVPELASF